ncbi:MAG: cupin domain-containing protein [Burkholderiales bacterium]|jgi:quercetin dioxygenase-like cupin family protein|nr:MAG: cupin domain-containing protein [Burkholderiales bacterium]
MADSPLRRRTAPARWEGVTLAPYKDAGSAPFRDITRQLLFDEADLGCELRYFEIAPGGHSTLERHQHRHAVLVLRGRGRCLVGDRIHEIAEHDLVSIDPQTWHQFRADDQPLGFLCLVNRERDRPHLPDEAELAALRADPAIAAFIRTAGETG